MIGIKKYKVCRRLGAGVYEKCQTQKFTLSENKKKFSSRGKRRRRISDYGLQLIEKQKVRFLYGIYEKQFRNYVEKAMTMQSSATPDHNLFTLLESRIDNIVFRLGLANSRRMARQMVSHGHFMVNGKRTKSPSHSLKQGDVITVREGSKKTHLFTNDGEDATTGRKVPSWLSWDGKKLEGSVKGVPADPDSFLSFQTVIEFYSR